METQTPKQMNCPVCDTLATEPTELCAECGWELDWSEGEYLLGDPEELQKELHQKYQHFQRYRQLYRESQRVRKLEKEIEELQESTKKIIAHNQKLEQQHAKYQEEQEKRFIQLAEKHFQQIRQEYQVKYNEFVQKQNAATNKLEARINKLNSLIQEYPKNLERVELISDVESKKVKVFGPHSGILKLNAKNSFVEVYAANLNLRDFIVEATFFNPSSTSIATWDYGFFFRIPVHNGFFFRHKSATGGLGMFWESSSFVSLQDWQDLSKFIRQDRIPNFNVERLGSNHIKLICQKERAWLYVNKKFAAEFDVSACMNSGDIKIGNGFCSRNVIMGNMTRYENFTIWSLE